MGFSVAAASRGRSLDVALGLLVAVASFAAERRLQGAGASVAAVPGL